MEPPALCRDCLTTAPARLGPRCPACGSPRWIAHPELFALSIAHLDCDAFYASVEKRDDPSLRDKPVIVGGGRRGVVTTACYIARIRGVTSAMPMFKALRLCPEAAVIAPRMSRYVEISRRIREMMLDLTPLVEPLSLDEAFLDLAGTERLHGAPPAVSMARLQARIERELGLTVSVGLSHNKFLAKIASDLGKPRGFVAIGRDETQDFLDPKPVGLIWGVGPRTHAALASEGLRTIGDIRARDHKALITRFGALGDRLWRLSQGLDGRIVSAGRTMKSISSETTFTEDIAALTALRPILWSAAENVSSRLKSHGLSARTVTLKLKRADHAVLTRRHSLGAPSRMADRLYRAALPMLQRDIGMGPFRLLGLSASDFIRSACDDDAADLLDVVAAKRLAAERATDDIRKRFGPTSIVLGRSLR